MKNNLISVIVPIYNVDKYLSKCLDSIINQTYKNLEVILIDDGSTDDSGSICDHYKSIDSRIVVIHKENGGLSSARNAGLDIASGSLVAFIDSDDYLELSMFEKLMINMDKYDSDIACCNFYTVNNSSVNVKVSNSCVNEFVSSDKDKFINIQNTYSPLTYCAQNKLHKKSLFDNIRFPIGRLYEYTYIFCDIFDKASRISFTLEPLYYYVFRSNSLGNTFNIKHFDKIGSFNKKIDFFGDKGYYDLMIEERNRKACSIISNLSKMKLYKVYDSDIYNKYYHELIDTVVSLNFKESNTKVKLFKIFKTFYLNLMCLMYRLYGFIRK